MSESIVLVGGGGHCRSCIDVIEAHGGYTIAGIVDRPEKVGTRVLGYPVLADDRELPALASKFRNFLITVGQIKSPDTRMRLFHEVKRLGAAMPVVVSPLARLSPHARVGEGTIVMHQALVNAGAEVGRNCIVNTKALVEHDVRIGDHCHVATGAVVNGAVAVGEGAFIGSGAIVREGIKIGGRSIVAAGRTVLSDVNAGETVQ